MPTLNIEGRRVTVDDSFLKLPPDEQNKAVDEIASSLKIGPKQEDVKKPKEEPTSFREAQRKAATEDRGALAASTTVGAQGWSWGASDEIMAGAFTPLEMAIGAITGEDSDKGLMDRARDAYSRGLELQRAQIATARENHPVASLAGEVAGGLATAGAGMGAAKTTLGRMAVGAGEGIAAGGVTGFMSGEGLEDRLEKAEFGAQVGAGLGAVLPAAGAVVSAATRGARRFTEPFTEAGRERLAARQLEEGASDPEALRRSLDEGAEELVPGSAPTTFQATGDMGIGGMERAAQTRDPVAFNQRRADQNAARVDALDTVQPEGAPETVSSALRSRFKQIDEETQAALDAATGQAEAARRGIDESTGSKLASATRDAQGRAGALGAGLTPDAAGDKIRGSLERARANAKAQERALWNAVDPDGTLVLGTNGLREEAQATVRGLPKSAKPPSEEEAAILEVIGSYRGTMPFNEVTALQSRLKSAMRAERLANGESPAWARMSRLNGAVESDLGAAIDGRARQEADAVAAGTMSQSDTMASRIENVPSATNTVFTPSGKSYPVEYEVVDASSLVSSNQVDGRANPAYPSELQPRDRTRAASDSQISGMSRNLQPERLGPSSEAGTGAPIIGADGVVESGNGRVAAIRRAYSENGASAKAYRGYLEAQGYALDGIAEPVLVRRRSGDMAMADRARFAQEANASSTLALSASEQAATDASRLTPTMLGLYRGGDIASAENRDFARSFLGSVADRGQEGAFVTGSGGLSLDGAQRMRAALMHAAYDDGRLVASLVDEGDENIRAFGRALDDLSGDVARLKAGVVSGEIDAGADLAPPLVEAARVVQSARSSGVRLADAVAQQDAFNPISPAAMQVLSIAYGPELTGRLSRERLGSIMRDVISEAEQQTAGARLFGEPLDIATILGGARTRYGTASGSVASAGADRPVGTTVRPEDGRPGGVSDRPEQSSAGANDAGNRDPNILPDAEPNFDGAARERLSVARRATLDRVRTFDNDTLAPIRRGSSTTDRKMQPSSVPGQIFRPGAKGFDSVETYRRAVGNDPEAMAAVRDYAVDRLQRVAGRSDGTLDPSKVKTWRQVHADALRAFPDLDAQLRSAAGASEAVAAAERTRSVAMRDAARPADAEVQAARTRTQALNDAKSGRIGKLAETEAPEDVVGLVGGVFSAQDSAQQMLKLRNAIGKDAKGQEGLRKAVAEHMSAKLVGNTEAATSGIGTIKSDVFQTFVRQNRAALRTAGFGDGEIATMEGIAADLQRANRSIASVKLPGQSNTTQDAVAVATDDKPMTILGKVVAEMSMAKAAGVVGGGTGAGFVAGGGGLAGGAALAGAGVLVQVVAKMREAGLTKVNEIVADALLNPERARLLLSAATGKAERDTLGRLAKSYSNTATITGALETESDGGKQEAPAKPERASNPAAVPVPANRERATSPRLTPEDRASPIPDDIIDQGKALIEGRPMKAPPPAASKGEGKDSGRSARVAPSAVKESWAPFPRQSGTMGIPRSQMPQIMSEHRGAMVNFLAARGIKHSEVTVPADSLKPTQREYSRAKVDKAKGHTGSDRSVLVSSDWQILDGHHQWLAKREAGEDVRVIRLDAPIRELMEVVKEFPSATLEASSDKPKSKLKVLQESARARAAEKRSQAA